MERIAVIGAGAWGTALALAARRAGREVLVWTRRAEQADAMVAAGENEAYLPGIPLEPEIRITASAADLADADAVLLVVPAQHLRGIAVHLAPSLPQLPPLVICAKGIEVESGRLLSQSLEEALPDFPLAVLSGPNFAAEVARGLPAAVTLACADAGLGAALVQALGGPTFRPYLSDDIIGSQVGGAVKNVIAIACGIVAGRGLGENARAALITRSLAEIARLCLARGGKRETLMGLSGIGDLTLTCTSTRSRNYSLGEQLGKGEALEDILAARRSVAEGVPTAAALAGIAAEEGLDMPICAAVQEVLQESAEIDRTIENLLARPFRAELA
jgi:glycerol-3-phosphate dehydrogenase (NAD(P)+)